VHTTAPVSGKIMAMTEPKHAVTHHFQNDPETLPEVVTAVRQVYDGPVDFAVDGMTWNVTKNGVRCSRKRSAFNTRSPSSRA